MVIVFAGTAQDAEVMRFAQANDEELGSLSVVVRHADDDELEETLGITIEQLVEEYGLRIPGIMELSGRGDARAVVSASEQTERSEHRA